MKKLALAGACLLLSAVSAHAQYVDGLPAAVSVSSADLMPVTQGSTPVVGGGFLPGSGVARRATVGQIANAVGNTYVPYTGATSSVNLGAFPLTLGVSTAPSAPGSGGALYVDANSVLHYLNGARDFPLGGAKFNNDTSINWWIGNYGVGDPAAPTNEFTTFRVQKVVAGTGGAGLGSAFNSIVSVQGTGASVGEKLTLKADADSGTTSLVVTDFTVLVSGVSIYGPGIQTSTTVSAVTHSSPVAGEATITLSQATGAAIYSGTILAIGSSAATESEDAVTASCSTWQTAGGSTCVGGLFAGNKYTPGSVVPFGGDFVATDQTGLSSTHSGSGVVGAEFDAVASGPDDNSYFGTGAVASSATGIRKGIDIVPYSAGPSADGATEIADGMIIRPPGGSVVHEPTTVTNAIRVMGIVGWGNFTNGITLDGSGAGQTGLNLSPGWVSYHPASQAASGATTIAFGTVPATVGQLVSDTDACIPAGTTVSSVSEGGSSATTITLSAATTCIVTTSDTVTLTNKFADGWQATGTYTDAFANLTNTGAAGVVKIGSTLATGTVGQIQLRSNSAAVGVIQASMLGGNGVLTLQASGGTPVVNTLVPFKLAQYTVATLPACAAATANSFAGVTDATSPTYNGALTGGGAVAVPVYCNGSAWTAH